MHYHTSVKYATMTSAIEDLDDVELTDAEKAIVVANEKAGLVSQVACHFCGMQFDVKKTRSLRAHIEEVHVVGDSGYMCGICCEEFTSRKAVENHMSTFHRAPRPMGCGICGETFRIRNLLLKHVDSHSKDEVENKKAGLCYCGECFEFFDSVMSLQAHVINHREIPIFVCAACGLQTQFRHIMVKHLETHVISSLLTTAEFKGSSETSNYWPQHVQIDASRIDSSEETLNQDMDTLDIVNSFGQGDDAASATAAVEDDASYKCGVCDAFFTNLADALTHTGTHQDEEGSMQQVEINVLLEEKSDTINSSPALDGSLVECVKTELLNSDGLNIV